MLCGFLHLGEKSPLGHCSLCQVKLVTQTVFLSELGKLFVLGSGPHLKEQAVG